MLTKPFPSQIRSALVFCPEIPQQQGPSLYPDFRDYTDAQFMNLALQPQERAHSEFNVHLWKFDGDVDRDNLAWQQWQSRLEHSILASCQVDVFLIACSVFTEIPRGFLQSAFVSLWDLLEAKHKVRVASPDSRYLELTLQWKGHNRERHRSGAARAVCTAKHQVHMAEHPSVSASMQPIETHSKAAYGDSEFFRHRKIH